MIFALALFAAAAAPAVAVPLPAPAPALSGQLGALVDLVLPTETIVAANVAAWKDELAAKFDDDPKLVAREAAEPGLRAKAIDAGASVVETEYRRAIGVLRSKAGTVYAEALTPQEIGELVSFFRTPTGTKLVHAMLSGIARSDKITPEGLHNDGKVKAVQSLDESDRPTLEQFAKSAVAQKTKLVSPKIAEISNAEIRTVTARLIDSVPAAWNRALGLPPAAANTGTGLEA